MAALAGKLVALVVLVVQGLACPAVGTVTTSVSKQLREQQGGDSYVTAYLNVTYRDSRGELHSERSETAKFGDGRIGSARGVLVHAMSPGAPGGCALPLVRHPSRFHNTTASAALPNESWIALVPRGHCTFDMKVHTAVHSGASAVIVYDDKEADTLDMMDISPEHNITAVLTYHWKGVGLAKLADSPARVYVEIAVANRCTRSLNSINRTSVLFVSVSFIVLMIISLAWLVFYYVQRFRYIHAKDRLSRRLCTAAKRALSKIPTRRLKIDDPELVGDGDCCAICIERYRVADVVRALPCRHEFHKSCIDPWLLDHRTCPMCKMDILKHYGFVFTGSQESILHLDIEEVAAFGFGVDSPHPPRGRMQALREPPLSPVAATLHHQQPQTPPSDDELPSFACMYSVPQECSPRCAAGAGEAALERCDSRCSHRRDSYRRDARGKSQSPPQPQPQDQDQDQDRDQDGAQDQDWVQQGPQPPQPGRPASPGAMSTASCGSGSSCCSSSGGSVTDSILPPPKRPAPQVVGCGTSCAFADHSQQ